MEKMKKINIVLKKNQLTGQLSENLYNQCDFCEKNFLLSVEEKEICQTLSGNGFYCPFCLRHRFNTRNNRDILIVNFSPIIGFYYNNFCLNIKNMYISELKDYIASHVKTGLRHPLFVYDPASLNWFIDFSRVGKGRKKLKLPSIKNNILNILICFNLPSHLRASNTGVLYDKYAEAIDRFYDKRWRPADKKILSPSLKGCAPMVNFSNTEMPESLYNLQYS
jgi:hypothetical protein